MSSSPIEAAIKERALEILMDRTAAMQRYLRDIECGLPDEQRQALLDVSYEVVRSARVAGGVPDPEDVAWFFRTTVRAK